MVQRVPELDPVAARAAGIPRREREDGILHGARGLPPAVRPLHDLPDQGGRQLAPGPHGGRAARGEAPAARGAAGHLGLRGGVLAEPLAARGARQAGPALPGPAEGGGLPRLRGAAERARGRPRVRPPRRGAGRGVHAQRVRRVGGLLAGPGQLVHGGAAEPALGPSRARGPRRVQQPARGAAGGGAEPRAGEGRVGRLRPQRLQQGRVLPGRDAVHGEV
mmetsp:Transcript_77324/g.201523  ORF Transcript_77324/g.201523 Transcript_77324/m.201523 type:complete len:220 (-) Transcript_77324:868-1527(-)